MTTRRACANRSFIPIVGEARRTTSRPLRHSLHRFAGRLHSVTVKRDTSLSKTLKQAVEKTETPDICFGEPCDAFFPMPGRVGAALVAGRSSDLPASQHKDCAACMKQSMKSRRGCLACSCVANCTHSDMRPSSIRSHASSMKPTQVQQNSST